MLALYAVAELLVLYCYVNRKSWQRSSFEPACLTATSNNFTVLTNNDGDDKDEKCG